MENEYFIRPVSSDNKTKTVKLAGETVKYIPKADFDKESEDAVVGAITSSSTKNVKDDESAVNIQGTYFKVSDIGKKDSDTYEKAEKKAVGYIPVKKLRSDGELFVMYQKKSKWPLIFIPIAIVVLIILILLLLPEDKKPDFVPNFIGTEKQTETKDPTAEVGGYSSYASVPDQTWAANTTEQDVTLTLPKNVSIKDAEGNDISYENPVISSPHIYVDLNNDGEFSEDECIYNPVTYDEDGNISDYGDMLKPGNTIDHITLTQGLPAGTYNAKVLWTSLIAENNQPANPMVFNFTITVQ